MSMLRFLQLDAFPASLGGGNLLGVVFGASQCETAHMQHFARWTRLVETTFVLPAQHPQASYRVSRSREINHDARLVTRIDTKGQVWVGGGTRTIVDGRLDWPVQPASTD